MYEKKKRHEYYCDCFRKKVCKAIKSRIVFGVVTSHYVSRTKSIYSKAKFLEVKVELASYRIHEKLICPEHFADNIKQRLSNKMIYSKEIKVLGRLRFR